jgi:hypothetical protein
MKIIITEEQIKKIINNNHKQLFISEEMDDNGKFNLYHVTDKKGLNGILKNEGFDWAKTGKGAGNMYGIGVYTTYDLKSTIKNLKKYGGVILKSHLKSDNNMLILDKFVRKELGMDELNLSELLDLNNKETNKKYYEITNQFNDNFDFFSEEEIIEMYEKERYSSTVAHAICNNEWFNRKFKTFSFYGENDGHVFVVRDFHNLIPIEYSLDNGETWKKITVTKEKEEITPKLLELINKRKKTGSWYNREGITLSEYNFLKKLILKSQKEFDNFIKSSKLDNDVIETIIDKDYIHLSDNAKYHILVRWRIKDEEKINKILSSINNCQLIIDNYKNFKVSDDVIKNCYKFLDFSYNIDNTQKNLTFLLNYPKFLEYDEIKNYIKTYVQKSTENENLIKLLNRFPFLKGYLDNVNTIDMSPDKLIELAKVDETIFSTIKKELPKFSDEQIRLLIKVLPSKEAYINNWFYMNRRKKQQ